MALLLAEKVSVFKKYANFLDVFFKELAAVLLEYLDINEHAIKLEPKKQLSYKSIYSLSQVELKTLKTYIEINLANLFIQLSKSSAKASILFFKSLTEAFVYI